MIRGIDGNLDCEALWSQTQYSVRVLDRISALASLLRVFECDVLSTPRPVKNIADHPWLCSPCFGAERTDALLCWGQTEISKGRPAINSGDRFIDRIWRAPVSAPSIAKSVNDKTFAHALSARLGIALPGSKIVKSVSDLEGASGAWVLKGRHGVCGRERVFAPLEKARVEQLLKKHGAAVYEPWLDRTGDFGATGIITDLGVEDIAFHTQIIDSKGTFRGIRLEATNRDGAIDEAGRALFDFGYRGPFGIDFFTYRDGDRVALNPLCEINARMTFGHVARALQETIGATLLSFAESGQIPLVHGLAYCEVD